MHEDPDYSFMDESTDKSFTIDREHTDIIWSHEDIIKLLDLILKHLPSQLHKFSYLTQVKKIPWPIIAKEMGNKEDLECQQAFHTILNGMDEAKNLTMVIPNVKDFLSKETFIDLSNLYGFIYYINTTRPEKRDTCFNNWLELSSVSRKEYNFKMMDILNIPKQNLPIDKIARKLNPGKWRKFSFAQVNEKVLEETIKDLDRYLHEVKEYKKIVPNWIAPPPIIPTSLAMKLYLEKVAQPPQIEYDSARKLYFAENPEIPRHISIKCPPEYIERYQVMASSYKEKLAAWKLKQSPATLFIYDEFFDTRSGVRKGNLRLNHSKVKKAPWIEKETTLDYVEFHNEPLPEHTNEIELYFYSLCIDYDDYQQKCSPKYMRSQWKRLDPKEQEHFSLLAKANQENYADQLLIYARNLDEDMRKIFIGFRRAKAFKILKRDVFNVEFPSEKYPAYVNQSREHTSNTDDSSDVDSDYDLDSPTIMELDDIDNYSEQEESDKGSVKSSQSVSQGRTKRKRGKSDTVKPNSKRKRKDSVRLSLNSKNNSEWEESDKESVRDQPALSEGGRRSRRRRSSKKSS